MPRLLLALLCLVLSAPALARGGAVIRAGGAQFSTAIIGNGFQPMTAPNGATIGVHPFSATPFTANPFGVTIINRGSPLNRTTALSVRRGGFTTSRRGGLDRFGGGGVNGGEEIAIEAPPERVTAQPAPAPVSPKPATLVQLPSGEALAVSGGALNTTGQPVIVSRPGDVTILRHSGEGLLEGSDGSALVADGMIVRRRPGAIEIARPNATVERDAAGRLTVVSHTGAQ
jgi:hypothetical protein